MKSSIAFKVVVCLVSLLFFAPLSSHAIEAPQEGVTTQGQFAVWIVTAVQELLNVRNTPHFLSEFGPTVSPDQAIDYLTNVDPKNLDRTIDQPVTPEEGWKSDEVMTKAWLLNFCNFLRGEGCSDDKSFLELAGLVRDAAVRAVSNRAVFRPFSGEPAQQETSGSPANIVLDAPDVSLPAVV